MRNTLPTVLFVLAAGPSFAAAQAPAAPKPEAPAALKSETAAAPKLASLNFLVGNWEAARSGKPGEPTGSAAFTLEVQGHVMVRRSYAEYPASTNRPASRHDDFMVIYEPGAQGVEADYYDNEGHIIHYVCRTAGNNEAVFVSDAAPGSPHFRLSYKLTPDGALNGAFDIAPPGKPNEFGPYLSWSSRKAETGGAGK